jgi:cellulose synthase/poly-beta-1,6-N-acetylglucosamine synthase-like glycosyltransferase
MSASLASGLAGGLLEVAGIIVVVFFLVAHTTTAALLVAAVRELRDHWDLAQDDAMKPVLASEALPTVSVVVTGKAPARWTVRALHSFLSLHYPRHEVVFVHDGAASDVLPVLIETFGLYQVPPAVLVNVPTGTVRGYYRSRRQAKLFVIDKAEASHADDLNTALNASRFPYLVTIDLNTRLEPDALPRLMRPFLLGEAVAAVAAPVRIGRADADGGVTAHIPTGMVAAAQAVEGLRDSVYARLGWNQLGGRLPTDIGVLVHRRDHLLMLDGFRGDVLDPELDLIVRLRAHLRAQLLPNAVPLIPDPVAWMPAASSWRALGRRRAFAHRGLLEQLLRRRGRVHAPRHGLRRLLAPLHHAAAVMTPGMEVLAYVLLVLAIVVRGAHEALVLLILLALPTYALLLSLWAVALEVVATRRNESWRDVARLCAGALAEQLGLRQFVVWNRLRATRRVLFGAASDRERVPPPTGVDAPIAVADETIAR